MDYNKYLEARRLIEYVPTASEDSDRVYATTKILEILDSIFSTCIRCGNVSKDGGKFCSECGAKLGEGSTLSPNSTDDKKPISEDFMVVKLKDDDVVSQVMNVYPTIEKAKSYVVSQSAQGKLFSVCKRTVTWVDL